MTSVGRKIKRKLMQVVIFTWPALQNNSVAFTLRKNNEN